MKRVAGLVAAFALIAIVASAHGDALHVRGTVTQIMGQSVTIQPTGKAAKPLTFTVADHTEIDKAGKVAAFKDVKVGEAATFKVYVRATANCVLTVPPEDADGFSVETTVSSTQAHVVTVRFEPKKPGAFRKELKLQTNLPGNPSAVILVEGSAK